MKRFMCLVALMACSMALVQAAMAAEPVVPERQAVLYLLAHQDDELGIVAKMATDLRNGRDVHVSWITDGAASISADIREKESRKGMASVGIPDANLHFMGFPDSNSYMHVEPIYDSVAEMVKKIAPVEIVSIAYEGGHMDHDMTSLMASLAKKTVDPKIIHYEFPLYNTYKNAYKMGKFIPYAASKTLYTPLDDELYALKKSMFDLYPSQAAILNMLKAMLSRNSLKKGEQYRIAPDYDYTKPPVEGTVGYEVGTMHPVTFSAWKDNVTPFLEKLENRSKPQ